MSLAIKRWMDFYAGAIFLLAFKPIVFILGKIFKRNHALLLTKEIVFIKIAGGGSLVIALPSLLGLKKKHPGIKFLLVCTPSVSVFAKQLDIFDELVVINDRSSSYFFLSSISALRKIIGSDTTVNLEVHSRMSNLFALFSFARNRISFYCDNPFYLNQICTHLILFDRFSGIHIFYDKLVSMLGASPATSSESVEQLKRQNLILFKSRMDIALRENVIAINHSCSDFLSERMLDARQWSFFFEKKRAELKRDTTFVFMGTRADFPGAEKIIQQFKLLEPEFEYLNLCGVCQLDESLAVMSKCNEFWGIDSGLLHFARLLVPKCISLWGPTDPETRLRRIENLKEEIHYDKAPCSPCVHLSLQTPCHGQNVCIGRLFDKSLTINPDWAVIKNKFTKT